MPLPKGKTVDLTFAFQKIDHAISSLNGRCFTPKEIHEITGINKTAIYVFLTKKTRKRLLIRIRYGCYRKVSDGILTQRLPEAFVATKVWRILCQSDKPLILREISEIVEKDTGFNVYFATSMLLTAWCRRKALDKLGAKKPYAYQVKSDFNDKDRPVATSPF